jgi:hypothetical protein
MADIQLSLAIIGVQKASTTALALYLNQHPKIFFSPVKETHFFRRPLTRDGPAERDITLLNQRFVEAPEGALLADGTPIYIYWPHALDLLKAHNPDLKLIISLRHPVERAYSAWSMERRREREPLSFSEAIRSGRARVQAAPFGVHNIYSYVERGFYAEQLARVFERFDRDQIFVLRSDQVAAAHPAMQAVQSFLGLNPIALETIADNVNPSSLPAGSGLQDDFDYLQHLYQDDLARLSDMIELDISDWATAPVVPDV